MLIEDFQMPVRAERSLCFMLRRVNASRRRSAKVVVMVDHSPFLDDFFVDDLWMDLRGAMRGECVG